MTKEEILAKSRNEKKDEGVEYIASRGRRWGVAAMSLMFIVLVVGVQAVIEWCVCCAVAGTIALPVRKYMKNS